MDGSEAGVALGRGVNLDTEQRGTRWVTGRGDCGL